MNANSQRYIHLLQEIYHKENIRFSVEQWIDQSVISQCLSEQIRCANVDPDLLCQYYHCKQIPLLLLCSFILEFIYSLLFCNKEMRDFSSKQKITHSNR